MTKIDIFNQKKKYKKILTNNERKVVDNSAQIKLSCSKIKHIFNKQNILLNQDVLQEIDNIIENATNISNIINFNK